MPRFLPPKSGFNRSLHYFTNLLVLDIDLSVGSGSILILKLRYLAIQFAIWQHLQLHLPPFDLVSYVIVF